MLWSSPFIISTSSLLFPSLPSHSIPIHTRTLLFLFLSSILNPLVPIQSPTLISIHSHLFMPFLSLLSISLISILQFLSFSLSLRRLFPFSPLHPPSLLFSITIHPLFPILSLPLHSSFIIFSYLFLFVSFIPSHFILSFISHPCFIHFLLIITLLSSSSFLFFYTSLFESILLLFSSLFPYSILFPFISILLNSFSFFHSALTHSFTPLPFN